MDKMQVAMCGIDEKSYEYYSKLCSDVGKTCDIEINCETYKNTENFLFEMGDSKFRNKRGILFLEIEKIFKKRGRKVSGTEIAKDLREMEYKGIIVFLTSSNSGNYYEDVFDVDAFNFVWKDTEATRFKNVFASALKYHQKFFAEHLLLTCAGEQRVINIFDIKYFEKIKGRSHTVKVVYDVNYDTPKEDIKGKIAEFEFIAELSALESQLVSQNFYRCGRALLINLIHIKKLELKEKKIILKDDDVLVASPKSCDGLKAALEKLKNVGDD